MFLRAGIEWSLLLFLAMGLLSLSWTDESFGESCLNNFTSGKPGFVLDLDDSVSYGANFLPPRPAVTWRDCVTACCKHPRCNLALVEHEEGQEMIKGCYLIDCLYKQQWVCRFFRKDGFSNYISKEVFDKFLKERGVEGVDRPPIAKPGLNKFVQPNTEVILTGQESKTDLGIVEYKWDLVDGEPSVIIASVDTTDVKVSNLKEGNYVFRLTVTDRAGQEDSATVNITVLTAELSADFCLSPVKVGPCRGSFGRWHFNTETSKCEKFTFGGCKGNRNNYLSEEECNQACRGYTDTTPSSRRLPSMDCNDKCPPLDFRCADGCCIRGGQECDGVSHCNDGSDENFCKTISDDFLRVLEINITKNKVHCVDPPVTGPCKASFPRWYYDPYNKQCSRFTYGGCDANGNNFEREDVCRITCSGVTEKDVFSRSVFEKRDSENSNSVGIAIAVCLGVAITIVLAILGYCFLKKRRKDQPRHQPVANGTTAYHMEDTERLVYNSTTKPV